MNTNGIISPYLGGSIWKTAKEAQSYIQYLFDTQTEEEKYKKIEDWGVYALAGDFDTDVYYIPGEPFHRLKENKEILYKVEI